MSDIFCAVCREPWDQYGARHGDMAPWEYELFKKGAGCPCCAGKSPDGVDHTEEHLWSVVFDHEDPDSFALLHAPDAKRPEWKRPPDPVLFECPGCGAKLTRDLDFASSCGDDLEWTAVPNTPSYGRRWRDWPTDLDELHEVDGKKYCPGCVVMCAGDACTHIIFTSSTSASGQILFGDTYDAGASHADPRDPYHSGSICTSCLEAIPTCSRCGEPIGDDEETDEDGRGECCAEPAEDEEDEADEEEAEA